jgi:hypothetical protein
VPGGDRTARQAGSSGNSALMEALRNFHCTPTAPGNSHCTPTVDDTQPAPCTKSMTLPLDCRPTMRRSPSKEKARSSRVDFSLK